MVGIVGNRPFEDRIVDGEVVGRVRKRVSEYAERGRSDDHVDPAAARRRVEGEVDEQFRQDAFRAGVGGRIGALLSKAMGTAPPEGQVRDARIAGVEAQYSWRTDQKFAANVAGSMAGFSDGRGVLRPDAEIRKLVPGVGDLPKHYDLRWIAVARAAIDIAHEHVERGDDHGLGTDLGRKVRHAALEQAANPSARNWALEEPVPGHLAARGERVAREVRNYMSAGPEVMSAITRQAMSVSMDGHELTARVGDRQVDAPSDPIQRQEWTRTVLLERHALARSGGMDDAEIIRHSRMLARDGGLTGDHSRDGTFIRPDAARTAARVAERDATRADRTVQADRAPAPLQGAARAAAHAADRGR